MSACFIVVSCKTSCFISHKWKESLPSKAQIEFLSETQFGEIPEISAISRLVSVTEHEIIRTIPPQDGTNAMLANAYIKNVSQNLWVLV